MKTSKKHFIFSFFAFLFLLLIAACDWETTDSGGNDTERPFRNITKNTPLESYTEEVEETGQKIIVIKDAGTWQEAIPYIY